MADSPKNPSQPDPSLKPFPTKNPWEVIRSIRDPNPSIVQDKHSAPAKKKAPAKRPVKPA
jgi:hypothetical protein